MHSREKPVGYVRTHFHRVVIYVHVVHVLVGTCTGVKIMAEDFRTQLSLLTCSIHVCIPKRRLFHVALVICLLMLYSWNSRHGLGKNPNHTSLNENYVVPCICLRALGHMHGSMWRATRMTRDRKRIIVAHCDVITIMLWQRFTVEVVLKVISVGTPAIRHIHVSIESIPLWLQMLRIHCGIRIRISLSICRKCGFRPQK